MKANDYKQKQEMARKLEGAAFTSRIDHNAFEAASNAIFRVLLKIEKLDCFVAQVALTVDKTCGHGYRAASISSKQALILACAAVENGIEWVD